MSELPVVNRNGHADHLRAGIRCQVHQQRCHLRRLHPLQWIGFRVGGPVRRRIHRARQHRVRRDPIFLAHPTCYDGPVTNRTEPKTVGQWIRYVIVAVIALFLVWWMLRVYVF